MTQTGHLAEASAFFALFTRSEWGSAHVRSPEIEVFVAREQGVRNPMSVAITEVEMATDFALEPAVGGELRAPHVGTVAELASIGTRLEDGECYARLDLLGETVELIVEESGTVVEHLLPVGALAEYDQPIVRLH